jgi:hypothetical protein
VSIITCHQIQGPFSAMMTFIVALYRLESFSMEVVSGATSLRAESPLPRPGLASAPSGSRLHRVIYFILQKHEGILPMPLPSKGSSGPTCEGDLKREDVRGLWTASPIVAHRRRGSIPMSRSCANCDEVPRKALPSLYGIEPSLHEP